MQVGPLLDDFPSVQRDYGLVGVSMPDRDASTPNRTTTAAQTAELGYPKRLGGRRSRRVSLAEGAMSALGHKRTFATQKSMSALPQ
jgi:hypothetical protein